MELKSLLHYRITGKLGVGGMGEVYEAEDTKLGRHVALKLLPHEFATRPDALERFKREARALAALNHPNIVTIYSVEQSGDTHVITMELVRGRRLNEIIPKSGMSLEQAFKIAVPLADSLAAAHEKGIGHRDLKPSNIMVTDKGHVKVIDFGLAKLLELAATGPVSSDAPTQQMTVTADGKVLGTPYYMSPEQVEGRQVDHRSDIFSLGIVLSEILTGERPFKGESMIAVMSSILKDDPPSISSIRPDVPTEVSRIIRRCLNKNPDERLQSALDLRNELQELQKELISGQLSATRTATNRPLQASKKTAPWKLAAVAAILLLAGLAAWKLLPGWLHQPGDLTEIAASDRGPRAPAGIAGIRRITREDRLEAMPCWSPDGKQIAFVALVGEFRQVFIRAEGSNSSRQVTQGEYDHILPAWGPGTNEIYYTRSAKKGTLTIGDARGGHYHSELSSIFVTQLDTGKESLIRSSAAYPTVAPGGQSLFFISNRRVFRSDLQGGRLTQLSQDDDDQMHHVEPRVSADESRVVFRRMNMKDRKHHIAVVTTNHQMTLVRTNGFNLHPTWHPSGSHIYFSAYRGSGMNVWKLRYRPGAGPTPEPEAVTVGGGEDLEPAFSPDGKRMVFTVTSQNADIYRVSIDPLTGKTNGTPAEPMPFNSNGEDSRAAWSPSAEHPMLAFNSDREGDMNIFIWREKDNSLTRVTTGQGGDYQPHWSPDLTRLVFFSSRSGNAEIYMTGTNANSTPLRLTTNPGIDMNPFFSPDGKRIAFASFRQGKMAVYVMDADGSNQRFVSDEIMAGHFIPWFDNESLFSQADFENVAQFCVAKISDGSLTRLPMISPAPQVGGHTSFSPDRRHILELNTPHSHLWVLSVTTNSGGIIYGKTNPSAMLDYPGWSPDGKWATFDYTRPRNSELMVAEWAEAGKRD